MFSESYPRINYTTIRTVLCCTVSYVPVGLRADTASGQPFTDEGSRPRHTLSALFISEGDDSWLSPSYTVQRLETYIHLNDSIQID